MYRGARAAALIACCIVSSPQAQTADDLIGTWALESSVLVAGEKRTDQFGAGATGALTFDARGHFVLVILGPDLPRFASGNRAAATADEARAVMARSISMIGTYRLDGSALHLVTTASSFPNWSGTDQIRTIQTLNAETLAYGNATASGGGQAIVTWKRMH